MVKRAILAILTAVFCVGFGGCSQDYYDSPHEFRYYTYSRKNVFGNGITFTAAVRGGDEQAALDEMLALMQDMNSDMSLTLSTSALARFNALGGEEQIADGYESERVKVSQATYEVIEKSKAYYADTDGAFNIAVYPLAELWHVDADGLGRFGLFGGETPPALPSIEDVRTVAEYCKLEYLRTEEIDGEHYIYKTHPRLKIDLGAVAKGYAADECVAIAKSHGVESALINISGNISLLGDWYHPDSKKYVRWEIGVTSPRPRGGLGGNVCALSVGGDKTLVTSGDYVRFYVSEHDGGELYVPHIVDGKTGLPLGVEYDGERYVGATDHIISATVICSDSAMADAYATALCLMGKSAATDFLISHKLHGILITQDGKMCLAGVTESDSSGDEYFVYKSGDGAFDSYKQYAVEEYSVG